jgi:hypothetical protein
MRTASNAPYQVEVSKQGLGRAHRLRWQLTLSSCLQEQCGLLDQPPPHRPAAITPEPVQLSDISIAELQRRYLLHQLLAAFSAGACHRHQVLACCMGADTTPPDLLLSRFRQLLHQGQPTGYPAHAPIELLAELLQALAKAPVQL